MSGLIDGYTVGIIAALMLAGLAVMVTFLNYSIDGWGQTGYRLMFATLAAFVAAPVWPLTLLVLLVFLYRRAFPKPTPEDLDERIRRAEREAGLS